MFKFTLFILLWVIPACSLFEKPKTRIKKKDYVVKPVPIVVGAGDTLQISSFGEHLPNGLFVVSSEGYIVFPYIGKIKVNGLKVEEVNRLIIAKLKDGYFRDPMVTVSLKTSINQTITIYGKVARPGIINYIPKITILEAITKVGGFAGGADKESITIMRKYKGRKYRIKVSIKSIVEGKTPNFYLLPGDIVIVPERII